MASEGQVGSLPATGQKNSVEIFLGTIEKAIRSARVYAYESGRQMMDNIYDNVFSACERAFFEEDVLDIHIKPFQMIFDRKVVYENKEKRSSLSFSLYEQGVRLMSLKRGISKTELIQIIQILATDFSKPENMDEDLYCLFMESGFSHFEIVGSDTLGESQQERPELKKLLADFRKSVASPTLTQKKSSPRRLRQDDVKILEEFRLNPQQFHRSDEEVHKIVNSVTQQQQGEKRERETLERLVLMGFHFLLQEKEIEQIKAGRELVTQVGSMMLEEGFVDLFKALIKKLNQLHRDQIPLRGEFQKVLDAIFAPDQVDLFKGLLHSKDTQKPLLEALLDGPPSAVRLMIKLLDVEAWAPKIFAEFILKHSPSVSTWLTETAEKSPDEAYWEPFVNILSLRPNRLFQGFLNTLLASAGETMKLKILRQCAINGTPESLQVFEALLKSSESEDRLLAYDLLPLAKNRVALGFLKTAMESKEFPSFDSAERVAVYSSFLLLGGEASYPWFESFWLKPGDGIFKSKSQNERRLELLKAVLKEQPSFVERILEKTPLSDLPKEIQLVLSRVHGSGEKR